MNLPNFVNSHEAAFSDMQISWKIYMSMNYSIILIKTILSALTEHQSPVQLQKNEFDKSKYT